MSDQQKKDPLHGITLELMLNHLVKHHGWEKMGGIIKIRCFTHDPSIKSSLQFLRKTPLGENQSGRAVPGTYSTDSLDPWNMKLTKSIDKDYGSLKSYFHFNGKLPS